MRALLALLSLMAASCSSNIIVVDEAGTPIQDATVIPLSRGISWQPSKTNKNGGVHIHQDIPTIHNIRAYKVGYVPSELVNYNLPKPITVVLKKR